MATCKHCGDRFDAFTCDLCKRNKAHADACPECHMELAHNIVGPPPVSRPSCPDLATAKDLKYHGAEGYNQ